MEKRIYIDRYYLDAPYKTQDFELIQIGRRYCTEQTDMQEHRHPNLYELTVITGGRGKICHNGVAVAVRAGDICLSLPFETHQVLSDREEPLRFDFLAFRTDLAFFGKEMELWRKGGLAEELRILKDERISWLINNLLSEENFNEENAPALVNSVLTQIIIYILRDIHQVKKHVRVTITKPEALCNYLMLYINQHLFTLRRLEELSAVTNYNYSYLSKLFNSVTGESLKEYLGRKKMEQARALVLEGRMSITEIAALLGYSSIYVFSRAFKNRFGISPAAMRRGGAKESMPPIEKQKNDK